MTEVEVTELEAAAAEIDWYHSIDLGHGVVTRGLSHNRIPAEAMPDFAGRSVLDIGAWDGLYSFLAERQGASRVVALDHYVWCLDFHARQQYWEECERQGLLPDHDRDERDFWQPEAMPGRRAFDFARRVLDSSVEPVVGDLMTIDVESLGTFDVVLYLGVLYHMREPLTALRRLRQVTAEVAVIETEAIEVPEHEAEALCAFYPGGELNRDYGNWYALSEAALAGMCRAAGFGRVETKVGPPLLPPPPAPPIWRSTRTDRDNYERAMRDRRSTQRYRIIVHAFP